MRLLKSLSILLIISNLSNIAFADDATLLAKGELSPYAGALLPLDKLQELRKAYVENISLNKSIELYKADEVLYTKKIDTLNDQNDKLSKALYSERSLSTWEKIALFGLGALTTGLIAYGVYRTK